MAEGGSHLEGDVRGRVTFGGLRQRGGLHLEGDGRVRVIPKYILIVAFAEKKWNFGGVGRGRVTFGR